MDKKQYIINLKTQQAELIAKDVQLCDGVKSTKDWFYLKTHLKLIENINSLQAVINMLEKGSDIDIAFK